MAEIDDIRIEDGGEAGGLVKAFISSRRCVEDQVVAVGKDLGFQGPCRPNKGGTKSLSPSRITVRDRVKEP